MAAVALASVLGVGALLTPFAANVLARPSTAPADPEQAYWERAIVLFGDEETNEWSLRVSNNLIKQRVSFVSDQLWKLDPDTRQWALVAKNTDIHTLVPPSERKPDSGDEDRQLAAPLDYIQKGMYGVFYAKWTVDGHIHGSTFIRLGPESAKRRPSGSSKAPSGFMWTVVPLNLNKAEEMLIPDPRVACSEDAAPSTQPAP